MPEPDFMALYSYTPEPPKKAPVIKVSCGIGDTDGFPAFDVDSEQYATKDDSKWGFLITGGAEFHMPLTVFQVTPDGLADKGGICLGDIILEINEEDATQLTLSEAHEKIDASGKKIQFLVKSMEDEEPMEGYEPGEERCIVLRVPKPPPPPKVSTIEKRLQELHRKLSEIAEIPKILSSTLATVSQTFDKLTNNTSLAIQPPPTIDDHCEQKRKMSYDEDVYDYELSDDNEAFKPSDEEEEFNVKRAYLQLKRYAARQRKSKDVTPESDYASESNFPTNETNDWPAIDNTFNGKLANDAIHNNNSIEDDVDDDDDEKSCDMYEEFTLSLFNKSFAHHNDHESESDIEEYDIENDVDTDDKPDVDDDNNEDDDNDDDDDDDDFLTTTFTWNLRNQSKLQRNDSPALNNSHNNDDNYEDIVDNAHKSLNVQQHSYLGEGNILKQIEQIKGNTPENDQKVDKLERSWPWADREKIIYKQSTCHLVPHKPLGLIEQRIQLLAKRNLLEHLNKTKNPQ